MAWAILLALLPQAALAAPTVAAASDLQFALPEIVAAFAKAGGAHPRLSFGSSGNFARQIAEGAPFELFLSADERYVTLLREQGRAADEGALYGVGRIVVFAPRGSPVKADAQLRDLGAALADGRLKRLAIANPEHAPYGRAAREALQAAGLWERAQPRLVLGENASQAAQFATTGSAEAGIIPYSLVRAPGMAARGEFALLPETMHRPLRQRMVLMKGAGPEARRLYEFLQGPEARGILERYGFALPVAR